MPLSTKRKLRRILVLAFPATAVVIFVVALLFVLRFLIPVYGFMKENNISLRLAYSVLTGNTQSIKEYQGRTNIAILGISGGERDGADLTDTIDRKSTRLNS